MSRIYKVYRSQDTFLCGIYNDEKIAELIVLALMAESERLEIGHSYYYRIFDLTR